MFAPRSAIILGAPSLTLNPGSAPALNTGLNVGMFNKHIYFLTVLDMNIF